VKGLVFLPALVQMATTVRELMGMTMAAMRALMNPAMARVPTMTL